RPRLAWSDGPCRARVASAANCRGVSSKSRHSSRKMPTAICWQRRSRWPGMLAKAAGPAPATACPGSSRLAPVGQAFLAEQAEALLHDAIREAEEHRVAIGLMADRAPARRHEDVARAPLEDLAIDGAATVAFDRGEHGGVGGSVAGAAKTRRQELQEG